MWYLIDLCRQSGQVDLLWIWEDPGVRLKTLLLARAYDFDNKNEWKPDHPVWLVPWSLKWLSDNTITVITFHD